MLNLTRRTDEQVYIETPWGRITVMVCFIDRHNGRVILGFDAPRELNIVRAELIAGRASLADDRDCRSSEHRSEQL